MYNFYIDGNIIKQLDNMGKQSVVGYTVSAYNEVIEIAEGYKKKLEDAGLIEKELTQEEILQKQNELLQKMIGKLDAQEKRLALLEGGNDD